MYQIFYDGRLIFDPRGANCAEPGDMTYALTEGTLTLGVGTAGQLSMTLAAGHPMIPSMQARIGVVKVVELIGASSATVFLGRIIRDTTHIDNSHTYDCEGRLACLNDTAMRPFSFPQNYADDPDYQDAVANNTVPAFWLGVLLEEHNNMCWDLDNEIQLGAVTVRGGSFDRESDTWDTIWRVINDTLPGSSLGGQLVMRYEGDIAYLDYLAEYTEPCGQAVAFSENLIDLTRKISSEDYFNALIPLGKDGMTCSAADPGYHTGASGRRYYKGTFYIVTPEERDKGYGNVLRIVSWPEVESADDLVSKAVSYLDTSVFIDELDVSAADISGIDGETPAFRLAHLLTIDDPPQDIRAAYAIVGLTIDILGDVETKLTLGTKGVTLTALTNP